MILAIYFKLLLLSLRSTKRILNLRLPPYGRSTFLYLLLLLIASGYTIPGYAGKKNVLFLGNSYTHVNNMPQIVADMALTTGDTLVFEMYAPGGYTIDNHSLDIISRNKIEQGGWDYLVLQEQSQLPSFPTYGSNELSGLCAHFRLHNPCGRIMFYMTWGRKNGDAANCPNWPPVCTYTGMDSLIRLRYTEMAINNNAELSPASAAWRYTRQHYPGIELYQPDESHPSAAGSYLVACSFYSTIFKKDPTAISYNAGLSITDANTLKQAAKAVVFDSLSFWDHAPTLPVGGFNYFIGNGTNQVNFINQYSFADSYLWDFGDGATSTVSYPTHGYATDGTYTVTLHAYNCDIDTTYESTHQMAVTFCPFTPTVTPTELTLCAGTSDTLSTQVYDAYQWYDSNHNAVAGGTNQDLIISSNDNVYYVKATLNGCTEQSAPAEVSMAINLGLWSISADGRLTGVDSACTGDTITLTVAFNKPPGVADSLIDWYIDGVQVAGYHNDTLLITGSGTYAAKVHHDQCASLDITKEIDFTFIPCGLGTEDLEVLPVTLAPNPAHDALHITSTSFRSASYNIHLVNQLGQTVLVQQSKATERQYLDVSRYPAGIYFISIVRDGHILYRTKVVKW